MIGSVPYLSWCSLFLGIAAQLVAAETHVFDWNITWVLANPDGAFWRPVIGINDQWPLPVLNLTKGDRVVANVYNGLGNETTSVHWHGMFQNGTSYMDGPPMVNQCEIPIGGSVTYNFTVRPHYLRKVNECSNSWI
jgi:iron transport multicopper oxidase